MWRKMITFSFCVMKVSWITPWALSHLHQRRSVGVPCSSRDAFWIKGVPLSLSVDGTCFKHCQRHNGPEGWVLLTKVTSLGHITSSYTNLDQTSSESRPSTNFKISTKHQHAFTSCRKVTQSFSNPENCYDITRQLASFKAIKFTKRHGVSELLTSIANDRTRVR